MAVNIVIAGAGDMGFHLAEQLYYESKNIILIDLDKDVLDNIGSRLDVLTIEGDSASIDVLKKANIHNAELMLAVTTSEKTNICTAVLAKQLGAKKVIARVRNHDYLYPENKIYFENLGIDSIISPSMLCSKEISRLMKRSSFSDVIEFEDGRLSVVGITLDRYSPLINRKLSDTRTDPIFKEIRIIAIVRDQRTIIPRGDIFIRNNDHVFFISNNKSVNTVKDLVHHKEKDIHDVMIIGGDDLAYSTARELEDDYGVTLIHNEKERCKWLAERLDTALIIHGDYKNINLLIEEGLETMDGFLALTDSSETNIITSLSAKNHGVYKTIAHVDTREYIHISHSIGVDSLINKKLVAANHVSRYLKKGQVEAVSGIQGVEAEFVQYAVTKNNKLTKKNLKALHFPNTAVVAGVIRGEEVFIPDGQFQLQLHDKAIVLALPEAKPVLEKLFN
ncbi:Trk system potassium transporter TrkA [Cyclobacterium marinum]|uniref:Trk system potassium uptake protein TrkA n=1 Tax=Cyclobacterium marinum (strain ATCC 25205 / DSM 745 / LMG 13164 / NCIMB 1802) TaxID=880070 RepID=G0J6C2_CYCMS|nr:Trk system potassium transporter TrkA [Cyclobacterium marinum]AEL27617.1 TrkA-N domain protein [Cyclobacterium marinum DSM 745]MBI0397389.1 Trk system potassium transporter TrkA [Cyclobacterium marinum]MBR9776456.1 Trk system potassium transporter TrkA [Cytophagales bacterium]|tara:strand:- start:92799 stop:94145 length:1347 start_codon:yes stop_codon:yes gene_type:complete